MVAMRVIFNKGFIVLGFWKPFFLLLGFLLGACDDGISVEDRIRSETLRWWGTPYEWGGETLKGVDCSGFTLAVFSKQFGITLPRKTDDQERMGFKVARDDLLAGDLVFFRTGGFLGFFTSRHVGIYLSEGKFAHASTSKGVMISSLEEPFWQEEYQNARRLIDESGHLLETIPGEG